MKIAVVLISKNLNSEVITMCLFCATKKAASNAYHQFMQRRKRARIFRNMQKSVPVLRSQRFGVVSAQIIETGNHKSVLPVKAGE